MRLKRDEVNNGVVTKLTNVRPHGNADRLQLATVLGATVVVGLDAKENDPCIYFDSNLALSNAYLHLNNLYSKSELNADVTKKGYFGKNGRVRAQRFRGEESNGYTASLESVASVCNISAIDLTEGMEFQALEDVEICKKYTVPSRCSGMSGPRTRSRDYNTKMFPKHWDTKHFRRCLEDIPKGLIYLEEKIHGTSGRMAYSLVERDLNWCEKLLQMFRVRINTTEWINLHGSRKVTLTKPKTPREHRFDHALTSRIAIFNKIAPHLRKGEQLYYEIAGFEPNGAHIQKGFPYGCNEGESRVFLYRITMINPDGYQVDMSREYVYKRAEELGMELPPRFQKAYYYNGNGEALIKLVNSYTDGKSMLDVNTIREGVVIWFDTPNGWKCLKNKSFDFLQKESKLMDDENYVDPEA